MNTVEIQPLFEVFVKLKYPPSLASGQAYRGAISEGDKAYESMVQKYQMDTQAKTALKNAGQQNIFGGIGDIGAGAMQFGMLKGMGSGMGTQGSQGFSSMGSNPALTQNILFGTGNKFGQPKFGG